MNDSLALRASYLLSRIVFFVLFTLLGLRRAVVRDNLARSFPELDPAARRRLRRAFVLRQSELAAEVFYGSRMGAAELRARVTIADPELLARAASPRPLILAGSHQGNFEWVLLRLSLELGGRLLALYKPLRGARADRWFHRMRSRFGARVVPAKSVVAQLAQFRAAAGIGIVADQMPRSSPDRHWTRFFGQETAFYMGPEMLGRALRSQVLFLDLQRLARGRYELRLIPLCQPDDRPPAGAVTERYARELERAIRADAPGWWWSHRRWKLIPPGAPAPPASVRRP